MFERRIEEAALNSWPALQQLLFDGWIIRFAQGYTRRANSVTPLYCSQLSIEEKVDYCQRLYTEQHLPTLFRLLSFSAESAELDQLLAQRGHPILDYTDILWITLNSDPATVNSTVQTLPLENWFSLYRQFSTRYIEQQDLHLALLQHISHPCMFAALYQRGMPVACGLAVLEHKTIGLFDIVTDPAHLRKGYGTQLVADMLAWGEQQGAQYAYLQVANTNYAAKQMYAKLGFQLCYQYWYRQIV